MAETSYVLGICENCKRRLDIFWLNKDGYCKNCVDGIYPWKQEFPKPKFGPWKQRLGGKR